ncbi:response regulator [Mongoliibacter ruber]|uniref:Response regulator receiver domain-containing protein n=1 Tax=Mongoliibacter ruber TaxID=1750599 RepID=A0A2T0WEL8_9BACT|nr:response regulator [Mongoliibacter ruber]PRY85141.1 response regulator receiver domain-containing protein [Mongoliibacter ruber]
MAGSKIHILLAEDNEGDILLTSELIEEISINCPLSVVRDGAAAVDFLYKRGNFKNASLPDFILLDINMPKKSGLEVLAILKNDPKLKDIPTAILTTSSSFNDKMTAQQNNADYFFTKPLEEMDLQKVLNKLQ